MYRCKVNSYGKECKIFVEDKVHCCFTRKKKFVIILVNNLVLVSSLPKMNHRMQLYSPQLFFIKSVSTVSTESKEKITLDARYAYHIPLSYPSPKNIFFVFKGNWNLDHLTTLKGLC